MQLNQEKGGYYQGPIVRFGGSFRIDGVNNPDVIRDGGSNMISSVVRNSAGLFTVTLAPEVGPVPKRLITWRVDLARVANTATPRLCHLVVDSYSQVTRSFQIAVTDVAADPAPSDPTDNDMISFELVGSISQTGTDAA